MFVVGESGKNAGQFRSTAAARSLQITSISYIGASNYNSGDYTWVCKLVMQKIKCRQCLTNSNI